MTAIQKSFIDKALKLPNKVKVRLAEKLIESIDRIEGARLIDGAKVAHKRIRAGREGKEESYSEEEILALLDKPMKP